MTKKTLFLFLFYVSIILSQTKSPKISSDFLIADFGKINQKEKVYTKFEIYNKGTDTLRSKNEIPPGGEGKIKMEFDSTKESGKIRRAIRIISDDPIHPKLYLNIYADVKG